MTEEPYTNNVSSVINHNVVPGTEYVDHNKFTEVEADIMPKNNINVNQYSNEMLVNYTNPDMSEEE